MTTMLLPKPTRIQKIDIDSSRFSFSACVNVDETEQIRLAERNKLLKELTGLWADRFSPEKSSDEIVREWRSQWKRY